MVLSIFRAHGRLIRIGDALTQDLGLTAARWQVLASVAEKPKTVAQIARDYELSRQGILWVVRTMAKDGIVELVHNPDHRRAKLVRATARGQQIHDQVIDRNKVWSRLMSEQFNVEELSVALHVVERFGIEALDTSYVEKALSPQFAEKVCV